MKLILATLAFAGYAHAQTAIDSDGTRWNYVDGSVVLLDSDTAAASWRVPIIGSTFRAVVLGCKTGKGRMTLRLGDEIKDYIWHYKGTTLVDQVGLATCVKGVFK